MNGIDLIIRLLGKDEGAKETVQDTREEVGKLNTELDKAGKNSGLDEAAKKAENFKSKLEGVRNAGLALGAIGAAGLLVAGHLADAGMEAEALGVRLENMASIAGLQDRVDEIKDMAEQLAIVTKGDDDAIGAAIGQALATGKVKALVEYGIVIDETGKKAIEAASKISESAGKQELFNQIMRAGGDAVANMRDNMSHAALTSNEFELRFGNMQEQIGVGAANARAAILGGILLPIMDIVEASPALQESAGYVLYIGSAGATAVGGIISLGAEVGILTMAFPGLKVAAVGAFTTLKASALSTIPALTGVASALAVPLAVLAAGLVVGVALYELLRSTGVMGPDQMSAYEILQDQSSKLKSALGLDDKTAAAAVGAPMPGASAAAMPSMPEMPNPALDAGAVLGAPAGGSVSGGAAREISVNASTQLSQLPGGDYLLKILVPEVRIPNDFARQAGAF